MSKMIVSDDNIRIKKKYPDMDFPSFKVLNPLSCIFQSREVRALGDLASSLYELANISMKLCIA